MALPSPDKERNSSTTIDELRLTLGEHLEELRGRLFRVAGYVLAGGVAGWFLVKPFWSLVETWVIEPLRKDGTNVTVTMGVTEGFTFWFRLAMTIGLVIAMPLIVWEIWGFIKPGLKPNEQKPIRTIVPVSVGLFFLGSFLGWLIMPPTMAWFMSLTTQFKGTLVLQSAADIVYFTAKMVLAFGLGFQLPLIVFFLARIGLVSADTIWRYWRQVTVAVFTISAIITPSGDPFSMMVMAVPMTALFFGSIAAAKLSLGKRSAIQDDVFNNLD